MNTDQQFLQENIYDAFNNRQFEAIIALMHPAVKWANGLEGGFIYGPEAVREYWSRQFRDIEVTLEPLKYEAGDNNRNVVTVRQIVKDLQGSVLADVTIHQIFTIEDGLISLYEIEESETIEERIQKTKTLSDQQK